jgi:hypothetical protein
MTSFVNDGKFIPQAPDKDPGSIIDYGSDWNDQSVGPWLAVGETIVTSSWIVPTGLTLVSESNNTTETSIFLSGGTIGEIYTLTNRIVTTAGRTEDRSMYIECVNK